MSVILSLRTDAQHRLTVTCDGALLAAPTPLADLPALLALQAAPYDQGRILTAALGGADLLSRLDADSDRLLLLDADAAAARIPWEYAALPDVPQFLGCRYALLRLVDRPAPTGATGAGTLQFLMLGADPLVDEKGRPRDGYRLQLHTERRAIRRALESSGVDLLARQIPPTTEALHQALLRGPAILHLSAHGDVIPTKDGPLAVLALEDEDGGEACLHGPDLVAMPDPGVLRLVVLSACHTAQNTTEADLARALVQNGAPAAIGMQGPFPDALSDDLGEALYRNLLAGQTLAQAVRHTRLSLSGDPAAAGLIVAYTARDGWGKLPLREGAPTVRSLRAPGVLRLPREVEAPDFFRGRNAELHDLAALYRRGTRVVTIVGTGGIGKTALAATFVERFGWRWPHGVLGVSFAGAPLDARHFRNDLLRGLLDAAAQTLAEATPADQERALMDALRDWDGLLLLDNYETVLQGLPEGEDDGVEARAIHSLVARLARAGVALLLTSREHPAKLAGERVFPKADRPLTGLPIDPAAALFLHHSPRATDEGRVGRDLAHRVAEATEGHPLAIALLAGEYEESRDVAPGDFLAHWGAELAQAEDYGLAEHHRTFIVAFERSYGRLPDEAQIRLRVLSVLDFPFFAQAATFLWEPLIPSRDKRNIIPREGEDVALSEAKHLLADFVRRSLLDVDGWSEDGAPATYRFQPALQQILAHQLRPEERAGLRAGYAAYGAWLARQGYLDIHKDPALSRVVRLSLDALDAATETLTGAERLWHIRRVTWIKAAYGFTREAFDLLDALIPPTRPLPDPAQDEELAKVESSLRYQLADLCVTRGDLDRALALDEESLQLKEQIGDLQGKAASLHQMAAVYGTRGDLDRALALYEESLQLDEHIGDLKGKAASLHNMANILMAREQWDEAEQVLQESQQLARKAGVVEHLAFATVKLGQVAQARGDAQTALARYREGLAIFERLGMPEAQQVRGMIANLEGGAPPQASPWQRAGAEARAAAQAGRAPEAVAAQAQAVALLREALAQAGEPREGLVQLSILLYNLAGYYRRAGRFDDAVTALEEVVALDERTGYEDLDSDREALAQARALADLSPEERAALRQERPPASGPPDVQAALEAQLAQLSPEERAQFQAVAQQFAQQWAQMSDEERAQYQAAAQAAARRQTIDALADQARDAAVAALRGEIERAPLIANIERVAAQAAEGESPGSPWDEVAHYLYAVVALLREQPPLPVPARYAEHFAAIQQSLDS